jgi:hypothetical protein
MDITPEEKSFIEEIGRRVRPSMGTVIKTRRGDIELSQTDKNRLDLIARREGIGAADLVNFYLAS